MSLAQGQGVVRIAVDAMGGDFAPAEVVRGVADFVRESSGGEVFLLLGDTDAIRTELESCGAAEGERFVLIPTTQFVSFEDHPMEAFREKKDSSLVRSVLMVKEGAAEAAFSAGNTGAFMVSATLSLEKMVQRPAIATIFPTERGRRTILVDAGANVDCRPAHLLQFALLGSVFAQTGFGIARPRVGLLSNGEEVGKGDELTLEAHKLLTEADAAGKINFVGNVEGNHVFENRADVVVCDGFVGNVLLKSAEGLGRLALSLMEKEIANAADDAARKTLEAALAGMRNSLDYAENGGAPLLGVGGVVIIAHGRSDRKAIKTGIWQAAEMARSGFVAAVREALKGTSA